MLFLLGIVVGLGAGVAFSVGVRRFNFSGLEKVFISFFFTVTIGIISCMIIPEVGYMLGIALGFLAGIAAMSTS